MVNPKRVRQLHTHTISPDAKGVVVYEMCRELRAYDNDALLFAQELAENHKSALIVNYTIYTYGWLGATNRFYDWVIGSLKEVEETLRAHDIPLTITFQEEKLFTNSLSIPLPPHTIAVVIDELPLRFMRVWKKHFLRTYKEVALFEVDAHNCIPVWELSPKQEFSARTIRSKVHTKLPEFLEEYGKLCKHTGNSEVIKSLAPITWSEVTKKMSYQKVVPEVSWLIQGEKHALVVMHNFFENKLKDYDVFRNDATKDGQSNLSPYISHGNIARRRIMLELHKHAGMTIPQMFSSISNGSNGSMGSYASFIEETVVRAELAENFCFYNEQYDTYEGFPNWAKVTLTKASTDTREYVYSLQDFEEAKTHDEVWNAAQIQMVKTGKMHGYIRMYWAKKILEWSASPYEAMKVAVYLNDTYELDGRDPNGYVGCAWSIGGLHDRPWFGRPIFGTVRYMARSGIEKKCAIKDYIHLWR